MITASDGVARALFGQARRRVLALLYGRPDEAFYLREIERATGAGLGPVQRELARLVEAGLVRRVARGKQVYFSAEPESPVFDELRSLVAKTMGVADVLRSALAESAREGRIAVAFVYGSVAAGRQRAGSDVDLFVVGTVTLTELAPVLGPVEDRLGREINPTIYPPEELAAKLRDGRHFVTQVLAGPKLFLVGSLRELEDLVGQRLADATPVEPRGSPAPARRRRS